MIKDALGDRMKAIEAIETSRILPKEQPVYARIDGRSFSQLTRGLTRPFDSEFSSAMEKTAKFILKETNANLVYNQSDEISVVLQPRSEYGELFFGGKVHKLTSVLAGMASSYFTHAFSKNGEYVKGVFDCRVMSMPSKEEAANAVVWRCIDARKNSISQLAHHYFSSKQLHGKTGVQQIEMLREIGVEYEELADRYKYGSFHTRKSMSVTLSDEEMARIPVDRQPVNGLVCRHVTHSMSLDISKLANKVDFVFNKSKPRFYDVDEQPYDKSVDKFNRMMQFIKDNMPEGAVEC